MHLRIMIEILFWKFVCLNHFCSTFTESCRFKTVFFFRFSCSSLICIRIAQRSWPVTSTEVGLLYNNARMPFCIKEHYVL